MIGSCKISTISLAFILGLSTYSLCGETNGLMLNPYNFKTLINCQACTADDEVLVVVHSSINPKYSLRRMALRSTWLQPSALNDILKAKVKIVFFIGATNMTHLQKKLEYENEMYGDIVQDSYIDSYRNNTYKAMSYLKWTHEFCPDAQLLMKIDDDVLINSRGIARFIRYLRQLLRLESYFYAGRFISYSPVRDESDPWYISYDTWSDEYYPTWFQGLVYFLSPSIAGELYNISLQTTYMHTDDVFVGVLVDKLIQNGYNIRVRRLLRLSVVTGDNREEALMKLVKKKWKMSSATFYHLPHLGVFLRTYYYFY